MWASWQEIDRRNSCFLALGLKPRLKLPLRQKLKAYFIRLLHQIKRISGITSGVEHGR